jgi:hypothetical protein
LQPTANAATRTAVLWWRIGTLLPPGAIFDPYNVIDERDLRAGVEKFARVTSKSHQRQSHDTATA